MTNLHNSASNVNSLYWFDTPPTLFSYKRRFPGDIVLMIDECGAMEGKARECDKCDRLPGVG